MKATIARRSENTTHTAVVSNETHWLKAVININFVINGHRDFWRFLFKHTKRPVNNFKLCVCFKCLPPHRFLLSLIVLRQLKTPKRSKNSSPISQLASTTLVVSPWKQINCNLQYLSFYCFRPPANILSETQHKTGSFFRASK